MYPHDQHTALRLPLTNGVVALAVRITARSEAHEYFLDRLSPFAHTPRALQ